MASAVWLEGMGLRQNAHKVKLRKKFDDHFLRKRHLSLLDASVRSIPVQRQCREQNITFAKNGESCAVAEWGILDREVNERFTTPFS